MLKKIFKKKKKFLKKKKYIWGKKKKKKSIWNDWKTKVNTKKKKKKKKKKWKIISKTKISTGCRKVIRTYKTNLWVILLKALTPMLHVKTTMVWREQVRNMII